MKPISRSRAAALEFVTPAEMPTIETIHRMAANCGARLAPAGAGRSPVSAARRQASTRIKDLVKGATAISPLSPCTPANRGHVFINGKF